VDHSGTVDYFEFLALLSTFREDTSGGSESEHKMSKYYFEIFDYDGNEEISRKEFHAVLTQMLLDLDLEGMSSSAEELDSVFNTIDIDRSQSISYSEFKEWFEQVVLTLNLG
jgi:Ca2+-binding EF-hand superfamily protein